MESPRWLLSNNLQNSPRAPRRTSPVCIWRNARCQEENLSILSEKKRGVRTICPSSCAPGSGGTRQPSAKMFAAVPERVVLSKSSPRTLFSRRSDNSLRAAPPTSANGAAGDGSDASHVKRDELRRAFPKRFIQEKIEFQKGLLKQRRETPKSSTPRRREVSNESMQSKWQRLFSSISNLQNKNNGASSNRSVGSAMQCVSPRMISPPSSVGNCGRQSSRGQQKNDVLCPGQTSPSPSPSDGFTTRSMQKRLIRKQSIPIPPARHGEKRGPETDRHHLLCGSETFRLNSGRHPSQESSRVLSSSPSPNDVFHDTPIQSGLCSGRRGYSEIRMLDRSTTLSSGRSSQRPLSHSCPLPDRLLAHRSTLTHEFDWPLLRSATSSRSSHLIRRNTPIKPMRCTTEREVLTPQQFLAVHLPSCEFDSLLSCVKVQRSASVANGNDKDADSIREGDYLFGCENKPVLDIDTLVKRVQEALESGSECLEMDVLRGSVPVVVRERIRV
ncbi:hypothetical protein TCDM_05006 [Trypanosoma cruzi Dm28c]|uniref:PDZ domain-containing protein n=2 Tax=Trypanosoma cruzi TaxID=5693 RepID=V5BJR5_TRYCR|nr:hypothetical protein TCDM_05006 [Trypanosoma cruzi Dm28c]PBJ69723.1 hypothetical protein BCY84_19423 [Trypanosoma cruzi cruzi]PWU91848.1 hypothetical protein C4B63_41g224 [Trypanosoma cruzi]